VKAVGEIGNVCFSEGEATMQGSVKLRKNVRRRPAVAMQPVVDPAGWTAEEIARTGEGTHHLSDREIAELDAAVEALHSQGLGILDITRERFPLPTLGPRLDGIREELLDGCGFALIRGFPVERDREDAAMAFYGIGTYFGRAVSQNAKGHLLGHVTALGGYHQANPDHRGYQTSESLRFHADSCDIVGLLCLKPAKSGGQSAIVSSVTVYNEMLKRRPDLVAELVKPWYMDRRGEVAPGKKPWYKLPIYSVRDGYMSSRGGGGHALSAQRFPDVPRLTDVQREALEVRARLTEELCLHQTFEPGDMQFLHNHVILHARTAYEDYDEPERRRHLLRLWLDSDGARPLLPEYADRINGIMLPETRPTAPLEAE
jgi:hypothetical protein